MCDCCDESNEVDFDDLLMIDQLSKDYARLLCRDSYTEIERLRAELEQARKDIARKDAALRRALPIVEDAELDYSVSSIIRAALSPLLDEQKAA